MMAVGSTKSGICEFSTVKTRFKESNFERIGWDLRSRSLG